MDLETVERGDGITFIELIGALDLEGVFQNEARFHALADEKGQPVIVDMSRVDYLVSLGIRMLVLSAKNLEKVGARMVLLNPQPMIEETLKMAGIHKVIPLVRSEEEAVSALWAG